MEEKTRILIVDDEKSNRETYLKILKSRNDLSIELLDNPGQAYKKLKKIEPDIILCGLSLPKMDGLEFCRKIKSNPDLEGIYFIMVSSEESEDAKISCMNEGVDDYLVRPVSQDELLSRIKVGQRITQLLKSTIIESKRMFSEIDVLIIQEGGCAPGYNPVTAFLTYHLEGMGREVFATKEGFKSLVDKSDNFLRLVYDPVKYKKLDHFPGVFHAAPLSEWRGAYLRSERFEDFKDHDVQLKAASTIKKKNVKAIIAIGGNGTFKGIYDLCNLIPTCIQVFFVPVTIDSDVAGTDCIGQHTGVEAGAEKIRCYMADARTHKRVYIVEMMGASSGFHALHSCLGSRAHLAVLPNSRINHAEVVEAINKREECVIVVAEGYKKAERDEKGIKDNAAEYFYRELLETKIKINKRVVCEPFSRDIRGAAPNNMDISLAQRMAYNVAAYLKAGTSRLMPAVQSGREYAIPFNQISTDNMKEEDLKGLANRLTGIR
ncbi:MAG: response regulator [Desulfatiglans sp.]|nr:response regulator [Desulfatiglans sp.]